MNFKQTNERAWIGEAVKALRASESWTGRIHVHKVLFVIHALKLAKLPFEFELYHYGPYSRSLDSWFSLMEAFGELETEYPKAGYGPKYQFTGENSGLPAKESNVVKKAASWFGRRNSSELELVATCIWAEEIENRSSDTKIVDRVKAIKPKFNEAQIKDGLKSARELKKSLVS